MCVGTRAVLAHQSWKNERKAEYATSIHHLSIIESVWIASSVQLSLRRRFHLSTSFIKSTLGSIWQAYTLRSVDKIISSLWIWLGSSLTWTIATLIWKDMSNEKVNLQNGGGSDKRQAARAPFLFKITLRLTDNEIQYFSAKQFQNQ